MATQSLISTKSSRVSTYRTRSKKSEVDECLFGRGKNNQVLRNSRKPETVQVITKDLIRNVVVPSKDPSGLTVVLPRSRFTSIKLAARIRSKEEIEADLENYRESVNKAMSDSANRKQKFRDLDVDRKHNEHLNDLELEAKEQNEHLLEKAKTQRLEQEDEIKHLNELILNAKCHAIRDAQILEKEEIKSDINTEEKRLDTIYELHRLNGIKEAEEMAKLKTSQKQKGARQIMEQIKTNTMARILEEEKKHAESVAISNYIEKLQQEDLLELQMKREQQLAMQKQIDVINQQQIVQTKKRAEEEKILERNMADYLQKKEEREQAFLRDQAEIKRQREEEINKLRKLQECALDQQAEEDALRAQRDQESTEREWRKKEKEIADQKAANDEMMRKARQDQIEQREHFQAVQAQRERQIFERILKSQIEAADHDTQQACLRQSANLEHAAEIRKQIRGREQKRIKERKEFFEEAERKVAEEIEHRNKLRLVKMQKLEELRRAGIPDKYTVEVSRRCLDDIGQKPLG